MLLVNRYCESTLLFLYLQKKCMDNKANEEHKDSEDKNLLTWFKDLRDRSVASSNYSVVFVGEQEGFGRICDKIEHKNNANRKLHQP